MLILVKVGHTQVRCKQAPAEASENNGDGGFDNAGGFDTAGGFDNAGGFDAPAVANGGWDAEESSAGLANGVEKMSVKTKGRW